MTRGFNFFLLRIIVLALGGALFVSIAVSQAAPPRRVRSRWTPNPVEIGASPVNPSWNQFKPQIKLGHGWLFVQNDSNTLYLLIDLSSETADDAADFLQLGFDIDGDSHLTPKVDVFYSARPEPILYRSIYLGPKREGASSGTSGQVVSRFGVSRLTNEPHRIWEITIPLTEIRGVPGQMIYFGIQTLSSTFDDKEPVDFTEDFSALTQLELAAQSPMPPVTGTMAALSPDAVVKRTITADGSVEIHFADGRVFIPSQCGGTLKFPNGKTSTLACTTDVQPSTVPPLPSDPLNMQWLKNENATLLAIITGLVGNDNEAVKHYLASEKSGLSEHDLIQRRTDVISRLLAK